MRKTTEESLYDIALMHSSFGDGKRDTHVACENNEKLESFGNYLLDYVIAGYLYDLREYDPGEMNNRLKITANANLADIVVSHNLGTNNAIRLRGSIKPTMKITANAFEAFIGAIHCAEGIEKSA